MAEKPQYFLSSFSVIASFVCLFIVGCSLMPMLSLQLHPSRAKTELTVRFNWHEVSARVVEEEVTSKLEGVFSGLKGVQEISSVSQLGSGRINIKFKKHINPDLARFEVASLIRQIYPQLPERVSYPELSTGTGGQELRPVMTYTLNASASSHFIQKYAEEQLVPRLARIKGLGEIKVYGATPFEWEVVFDLPAMKALGLNGRDVQQAIDEWFQWRHVGKGYQQAAAQSWLTEQNIYFRTSAMHDLRWHDIPVGKSNDRIIYLADIGTAIYKEQKPKAYFRVNGLNTINLVLYPEREVNTLQLARDIRNSVDLIRDALPPGYSMALSYDSTEFLSAELNKIALRSALSLLFLLVFVLLVSRQFRYLLLIFISLAASLAISSIFFYLFSVEIQLYSLAGITISFGIIIDNTIVMVDHLRHHGNRKAFLAILAATLTTIGSLSVIFFLSEAQRFNLIDFALVIIITLSVSLAVAYLLMPALMDKLPLSGKKGNIFRRRKKRIIRFSSLYTNIIIWCRRWRWAFIILLIMGFGIPVYWLPDNLEGEGRWPETYNKTIGSQWFKNDAKPWLTKVFGGSMGLFVNHVFESSFYSEPDRTRLYVRGVMPEGCTVEQLNEAIEQMENYMSQFEEIEMFQTSITAYNNSSIMIHFKPEYEWGGFPYQLKSRLESKAISLGGLDWAIYGVGRGFSNALYDGYKNSRIVLEGYNYEMLYAYGSELRLRLLENPRIREVDIVGTDGWQIKVMHEYVIDFNHQKLALAGLDIGHIYAHLQDYAYHQPLNPVFNGREKQAVSLVSGQYNVYDLWDYQNLPVSQKVSDEKRIQYKMDELGKIEKRKTGNDIHKKNQNYTLVVAYDLIGPQPLAKRIMDQQNDYMNEVLPLGFRSRLQDFSFWNRKEKKQYYLIFLVIVIIYFICAIVLESLLQPLAIIAMIPISFIGLFLTFYLFDLNFDQGGFAAFILLSGLSVNAGLYIINDYNHFVRRGGLKPVTAYVKAYNHKIIAVLLTILSTIIGLLPFVIAGQKEVFWFAFAAGTCGGLLFSFIGIMFFLPVLVPFKKMRVGNTRV